jgi:hypothetical protein
LAEAAVYFRTLPHLTDLPVKRIATCLNGHPSVP